MCVLYTGWFNMPCQLYTAGNQSVVTTLRNKLYYWNRKPATSWITNAKVSDKNVRHLGFWCADFHSFSGAVPWCDCRRFPGLVHSLPFAFWPATFWSSDSGNVARNRRVDEGARSYKKTKKLKQKTSAELCNWCLMVECGDFPSWRPWSSVTPLFYFNYGVEYQDKQYKVTWK